MLDGAIPPLSTMPPGKFDFYMGGECVNVSKDRTFEEAEKSIDLWTKDGDTHKIIRHEPNQRDYKPAEEIKKPAEVINLADFKAHKRSNN